MWRCSLSLAVGVMAAGCGFDADYASGHFLCSDGVCPTGDVCRAGTCFDKNTPIDAPVDVVVHAGTCVDPIPLGVAATGTTVGRDDTVDAMCNGVVQRGGDVVYSVPVLSQTSLHVTLGDNYTGVAYLLGTCEVAPATPPCAGGVFATLDKPLQFPVNVTGSLFLIVDGPDATTMGAFTVTADLTAGVSSL